MAKPHIVLLHGFMGTTFAHFGKAIRHWYGRLHLVGIDLPGHGKCLKHAPVNYYADTINYVIDKICKYQKVLLIGVSYLGGTIAFKIANERPNLLEKLIVTGFTYDVPERSFCFWANNFQELVKANPTLATEYQKLHGDRWEETMKLVVQDINLSYNTSIKISSEILQALKLPVMLINGDYKDSEVSAANNFPYISNNFYGRVIADAGHIVAYDKPIEFCENVENFLEQE